MSAARIFHINRPLFALAETHPAHCFLKAFIECLRDCVGKEIPYRGAEDLAIDQEWFSQTDLRNRSFSGFTYEHLSYTIELDGWLSGTSTATPDELNTIDRLPYFRALMTECKAACIDDKNAAVLDMVEQVERLLDLWERCIKARWRSIGFSEPAPRDGDETM